MTERVKIKEGKVKILFEGPDESTTVLHFKDDITYFHKSDTGFLKKRDTFRGKGEVCASISQHVMTFLGQRGIRTHFIKSLSPTDHLCHRVRMLPLEIIVRNVVAGSLKRLGLKEGECLSSPLIEYYYKSDAIGDPLVSAYHAVALGWATHEESKKIDSLALRINALLSDLFLKADLLLVDFKLEFGCLRDKDDKDLVLLADDVTPDSCRLWDVSTGYKLDKDRFRFDLGRVEEAYYEVARRLGLREGPPMALS